MIRDLLTRGFGNGTYSGTVALVVMRGYAIGAPAPSSAGMRAVSLGGLDRSAVSLAGSDASAPALSGADRSTLSLSGSAED